LIACADSVIYAGTGPIDILCDDIWGANGNCEDMEVHGGPGVTSLTCSSRVGYPDCCYGLSMNQGDAILTQYDNTGATFGFACASDQWQCPESAYHPDACVSQPCECGGPDQCALVFFWNGLTSKGALNWNTAIDLCDQGATGINCSDGRLTSL